MTLVTVPEALSVVRTSHGGPDRLLVPPVWVDVVSADAVYAESEVVVVERGVKAFRFVTPDAVTAGKRAKELSVIRNLRGGRR